MNANLQCKRTRVTLSDQVFALAKCSCVDFVVRASARLFLFSETSTEFAASRHTPVSYGAVSIHTLFLQLACQLALWLASQLAFPVDLTFHLAFLLPANTFYFSTSSSINRRSLRKHSKPIIRRSLAFAHPTSTHRPISSTCDLGRVCRGHQVMCVPVCDTHDVLRIQETAARASGTGQRAAKPQQVSSTCISAGQGDRKHVVFSPRQSGHEVSHVGFVSFRVIEADVPASLSINMQQLRNPRWPKHRTS